MAELFGRDVKTIGKHIGNALREDVDPMASVAKFATLQKEDDRDVERMVEFYNLDVIISTDYQAKLKRRVKFRKWANTLLRKYITQGYLCICRDDLFKFTENITIFMLTGNVNVI